MASNIIDTVEYQTFVVSSIEDSTRIDFKYPYQLDTMNFTYRLKLTGVYLQFAYRNVTTGGNTVTILTSPIVGAAGTILTLPEGSYDFATMQLWWNAQNWLGTGAVIGYSSITNRVAITLNGLSSIRISAIANLLGSAVGDIVNTLSTSRTFVCLFPPQFASFNCLLAICNMVKSGMVQTAVGNVIGGVVAALSLGDTNPGEYLNYDTSFASVPDYVLMNPSFTLTIADDSGVQIRLDNNLKTTIAFTIIVYQSNK